MRPHPALRRRFDRRVLLALPFVLVPCLVLAAGTARGEGEMELRRNAVVRAVEAARPAIVSIRTNQLVTRTWYDIWDRPLRTEPFERDGGLGSGVIFHPDGYVLTNAHVISRASKIFVAIQGGEGGDGEAATTRERRALPLAIDIGNDLAILRLLPGPDEPAETYPAIRIGRSDDVMLGETVIAMGHPFRLGLTVTTGIVSGLNRHLELRGREFDDFMQVDAAINPGNSGGPLFDVTGRMIGLNTAIYNRAVGAEGIGFAIPADRVRALVATAFKRRVVLGDWLGIEFEQGPQGRARVQRVYPKGPAAASGLQPQDVVVSLGGTPVPTLYDLRMAMVAMPPGGSVVLGVRGPGPAQLEREVRIPLQPVPTNELSLRHLGFLAEDSGEFNGVVVATVEPNGPADTMTLRPHDVIYGLGPWEVRNTEDLLMFLQFVTPGDLVDVKIRRAVGTREARFKGSLRAR